MCTKFFKNQSLTLLNTSNTFLKKRGISLLLPFIFFSSCTQQQKSIKDLSDELASFECRAISLRNQRFELADKIRFTQDTLLNSAGDTLVLNKKLLAMDAEKQALLDKSIRLADTIGKKTAILMRDYFTDKKKEIEFYRLLEIALKKKGCK